MEATSKTQEAGFVAEAQERLKAKVAEVRENLADVKPGAGTAVGVMSTLRAVAEVRRTADEALTAALQLGLDSGLTLAEIGDSIEGLRPDNTGPMQRGNVNRTLRRRGVVRRVDREPAGA